MSYQDLLRNLAFEQDPFATTNADEEYRLPDYFIAPPFYMAVHGEQSSPKPALVFAPRGGGKTALKRMIELSSDHQPVLCIVYNRFETANMKLNQIDLDYHLKNIIILMLVNLIEQIRVKGVDELTHPDRHVLYMLIKQHLSTIDQTLLHRTISDIRLISSTAVEWWNKVSGPASSILSIVTAAASYTAPEIKKIENDPLNLGGLLEQLKTLGNLAKTLGYLSTYILIDRVDENDLTGNDARKSFAFIRSLLMNLNFLQLPGFAIKFFLWHPLIEEFREQGRPDRISIYELQWSESQLMEMLANRLKAYSNESVISFSSLCEEIGHLNIDEILALLSEGSPRNLIRLCQSIIDQQSEIDSTAKKLSLAAINDGVRTFSSQYCHQMVPAAMLRDLQKVQRADFTVSYVYREIFKVSQPAGLAKIRNWQSHGLAKLVGATKESSGSKPSYSYALSSVLLAHNIFSHLSLFDFMKAKVLKCHKCSTYNVRDWDVRPEQNCSSCQQSLVYPSR